MNWTGSVAGRWPSNQAARELPPVRCPSKGRVWGAHVAGFIQTLVRSRVTDWQPQLLASLQQPYRSKADWRRVKSVLGEEQTESGEVQDQPPPLPPKKGKTK